MDGLRGKFLEESHGSQYFVHLGVTKMYSDLQEVYWLDGIKRDVEDFVVKGPNCQQVNAEDQRLGGPTEVMDLPTWKWEDINMDLIVSFPHTGMQNDSIRVIVDRLTISSHFITHKVHLFAERVCKVLPK